MTGPVVAMWRNIAQVTTAGAAAPPVPALRRHPAGGRTHSPASTAIPCAACPDPSRRCAEVLGVKLVTSETKEAGNVFYADLVARGLSGVLRPIALTDPGRMDSQAERRHAAPQARSPRGGIGEPCPTAMRRR